MNNYLDFYDKLNEIKIYDKLGNISNKDEILSLIGIYFSLVCDGNLYMDLDKNILSNKWNKKLDGARIRLREKDESYDNIILDIIDYSNDIYKYLGDINDKNLFNIVGINKLFIIEDNKLYLRKYYNARKIISNRIKELYKDYDGKRKEFDFDRFNFKLEREQEEIVAKGYYGNLIVTGGPGTGKTTSILFLIIALLESGNSYDIHITAPSGKAAMRIKESITGTLDAAIPNEYRDKNIDIMNKLMSLEGQTIHRLLGYNGDFKYNKNNQFPKNSIFIIDEASMIDATLFASLLEAIPNGARVYILGDKDQLPSVECGAVFSDLLISPFLNNSIVRLVTSKRFKKDSPIDILAKGINIDDMELPKINWKTYDEFKVLDYIKNEYKIEYFIDNPDENKIIDGIVNKWIESYHKDLKNKCDSLDYNDIDSLRNIFSNVEYSKILCAENESIRGVKKINRYITRSCYTKDDISINGFHVGEILMVNQNDYNLDLFNGDMGIVVRFKDDDMLYLMLSKSSNFYVPVEYRENKIFKKEEFIFYPLRMISRNEIDLAYAISVHKSQGSDYKNILVFLPKDSEHPLLNRQIVYTAITRTKGNTYIVSNENNLLKAKNRIITRDTNINIV